MARKLVQRQQRLVSWIVRMAQTNALKLVYLRSVGSIAAAREHRASGHGHKAAWPLQLECHPWFVNERCLSRKHSDAQLHQSYDLALLVTSSSLHNSAQWAAPPPGLLL
jgi:hypothetical protein